MGEVVSLVYKYIAQVAPGNVQDDLCARHPPAREIAEDVSIMLLVVLDSVREHDRTTRPKRLLKVRLLLGPGEVPRYL